MQKKRARAGRGQGTQTHKDRIIAKVKMMERYSRTDGGGEGGELEEEEELLFFYEQGRRLKKVVVKGELDSY